MSVWTWASFYRLITVAVSCVLPGGDEWDSYSQSDDRQYWAVSVWFHLGVKVPVVSRGVYQSNDWLSHSGRKSRLRPFVYVSSTNDTQEMWPHLAGTLTIMSQLATHVRHIFPNLVKVLRVWIPWALTDVWNKNWSEVCSVLCSVNVQSSV